jgi:hypothetical protein
MNEPDKHKDIFIGTSWYNKYYYTVAEQTCELIIWKIPQNVWVENLRNMLYQLFR